MSEKDNNCDETNVENDGMGDRNAHDFELPDCCRPMVERMMKSFDSAPDNETDAREGARNSDLPDWCKSMMIQMMRARGKSREGDSESVAESPGSCCGEPR